MQVFRDLTPTTEYTAVALGYFDGVHTGHRAVLSAAAECKKEGLVPIAFTFSSTPKADDINIQLSTYEEKYHLFEQAGIEILYIIDFEKIRNKSPQAFITEIVRDVFHAKKVFCGFNYHFGKNGSGDLESLKTICRDYNIRVNVTDPVIVDGTVVSSTEIRRLLQEGNIQLANRLLGYDYGICSTPVKGNRIGTVMDTPTINQPFEKNMILPKFGVYASLVTIEGATYYGVTNIGIKPTISPDNPPLCETWLPLYTGGDLYGEKVDTRLKAFIRPEKRFDNLNKLKAAIKHDGNKAVELLQQLSGLENTEK